MGKKSKKSKREPLKTLEAPVIIQRIGDEPTLMERLIALEGIYAQIPNANCKGLCHDTCANIGMEQIEADRIQRIHGVTIPRYGPCPALTEDKRCGVYKNRPAICRIFGTTPATACPHGCEPDGGWIPDTVAQQLLQMVERISPRKITDDRVIMTVPGVMEACRKTWLGEREDGELFDASGLAAPLAMRQKLMAAVQELEQKS